MPQLYCQLASRPDPWLLGRTSAGLCTLQTACPLTVTYSGGSPAADTIAAGSAATVYGGSAATFDASADVWVVLTVPTSGALQVVKEADLATVTGDWTGLARIVQHSTEPYQPQAYLGAGGAGTAPTTTQTVLLSSTAAKALSLWNGSSNNSPPSGWSDAGFNDSGWAVATTATLPAGTTLGAGETPLWTSANPVANTEAILVRQSFSAPVGTPLSASLDVQWDDNLQGVWVNGTLLASSTLSGATGSIPHTFAVPPALLVPGGTNVVALEVANTLPSHAYLSYSLTLTYGPTGGLPAPTGPAEGDLLYYHSGAWVPLPAGPNGYELTMASGDPAWTAQPATGTVSSVALAGPTGTTVSGSPVTSSGTLTLSWASQSANTVLAAPNGSSGAPTFRALVGADVPTLPASQITSGQLAAARGGTGLDTSAVTDGQLLIGQSSDHTFGLAALTAGSGVTITNAGHGITIAASGGSGTVTSVTLTVPGFLSVSGSPITTSGTLAVTLATQSAGTVFAGPASGSAAAPTFRALQGADLPPAAAAGGHIHAHGHFL